MKATKIQQLTRTALLLALCIATQYLIKDQYITGSVVNAILILTTLFVGLPWGLSIAVISPVFAMLAGVAPVMVAVPLLMVFVALGNAIMVLSVNFLKGKKLPVGLVLGTICKGGFLFLTSRYIILTFFAESLKGPQQDAIRLMFATPQFITAAIGSALAFSIYMILKNTLLKKS